jgi:hypothetical protein
MYVYLSLSLIETFFVEDLWFRGTANQRTRARRPPASDPRQPPSVSELSILGKVLIFTIFYF